MFLIKGETHHGWALVDVFASGRLETTLIGFAYETTPGAPINAGQTSVRLTIPPPQVPDR